MRFNLIILPLIVMNCGVAHASDPIQLAKSCAKFVLENSIPAPTHLSLSEWALTFKDGQYLPSQVPGDVVTKENITSLVVTASSELDKALNEMKSMGGTIRLATNKGRFQPFFDVDTEGKPFIVFSSSENLNQRIIHEMAHARFWNEIKQRLLLESKNSSQPSEKAAGILARNLLHAPEQLLQTEVEAVKAEVSHVNEVLEHAGANYQEHRELIAKLINNNPELGIIDLARMSVYPQFTTMERLADLAKRIDKELALQQKALEKLNGKWTRKVPGLKILAEKAITEKMPRSKFKPS